MFNSIKDNPLVSEALLSGFRKDVLISVLSDNPFYADQEIISWFSDLKLKTVLNVSSCHMDTLDDWSSGKEKISHKDDKYFEIIGISAEIGNREVERWNQPIMRQKEAGIAGFLIKKINSVYHILVQAKLEPGNMDILEMAPTVQCITGSYTEPEYTVTYLDYFIEKKGLVHYDTMQSEEGGRFFQEQNRYMIIEPDENFQVQVHKNFIWMTFRQAKEFIMFNNYFNIEARSLISCVSPI